MPVVLGAQLEATRQRLMALGAVASIRRGHRRRQDRPTRTVRRTGRRHTGIYCSLIKRFCIFLGIREYMRYFDFVFIAN